MATKTAFPGTTSSGDVLHSADITKLPGGWIGYVEKTTNQTGISSITAISGLSVTVTVGTSRTILITGHFGAFDVTSNCYVKGYIRESSTTLGVFVDDNLLAGQRGSGEGSVWLQPSAGSHTTLPVDVVQCGDGRPRLHCQRPRLELHPRSRPRSCVDAERLPGRHPRRDPQPPN